MKIALIGDVHANLPALEAILAHAHRSNSDAIWNIGDFVGYGPFPDQVVRLLRAEHAKSIIGNYDLKALKVKKKLKKWRQSKIPEKWLAFQWAYDHLSPKSRKYLRALPRRRRFKVSGWRILLVHGSPASINEHLSPSTPEPRLRELATGARADIIICGHSHQPFARRVDDTWFINTGSVGRPDDGDPRACYALLELARGSLDVAHYRIEYDVERTARAIRSADLPEEFAQMILKGVSLDTLRSNQGTD
jgi:putative phosphoesterase